jgi:hypothetical protein
MSYYYLAINRLTGPQLVDAVKSKSSVIHLNLSAHNLKDITGSALAEALAFTPGSVTTLSLSGEGFGLIPGTGLAKALSVIPANVTSLALSSNRLYGKSGAELAQAFAAIPDSVTSLSLNDNALGRKTSAELVQAFSAIPTTVTSLNLSHNNLGYKTGAELAQIFAAIPVHVKTINLEYNELFTNKRTIERDKTLKVLGNNRERFILTNNGESDLARALAPMATLKSEKKLPSDITSHILSFLPTENNEQRSHSAYKQQLKKTEDKINKIMTDPKNTKELREIRKAANLAINNYLSWSKGENNLRGPNGWFTWLRHGQAGRDRAEKLRNDINASNNDPISVINEFLTHPKTRYHRHSLASFLLDELSQIKGSPWENTDKFPAYKR